MALALQTMSVGLHTGWKKCGWRTFRILKNSAYQLAQRTDCLVKNEWKCCLYCSIIYFFSFRYPSYYCTMTVQRSPDITHQHQDVYIHCWGHSHVPFFFSSHIYITQVTLNEPFTSCKPFPTQTFLSKHPKLFWEWQYWQKNSCRSSMDTTHLQDAVSVESPKIPTIASRNQRHIITSQKRKLPTKAATNLASNGLKCK